MKWLCKILWKCNTINIETVLSVEHMLLRGKTTQWKPNSYLRYDYLLAATDRLICDKNPYSHILIPNF